MSPQNHRGLFVTLEGGDGAGKTTQASLLETWLSERGHTTLRTREPGGTHLGATIRQLLLHSDEAIDPKAEALLYAADRAQHVAHVVRPALEAGTIVIQDRYIDSSLAYQGAGRVLSERDVENISVWASGNLWPDLTILLDISAEIATQRMVERGGRPDRLEREAHNFHEAVRQGFLARARSEPARFLTLDAAEPAAELQERIRARLHPLLPGTV